MEWGKIGSQETCKETVAAIEIGSDGDSWDGREEAD